LNLKQKKAKPFIHKRAGVKKTHSVCGICWDTGIKMYNGWKNVTCPDCLKKKRKKKKKTLAEKKALVNSDYWLKKADDEWKRIIHNKYGECLINNEDCEGSLEAHHLISRRKGITRHDPANGVLLCSNHHKWSVTCSPHGGPIGFSDFLKGNFPDKYHYVLTNQWTNGKHNYREAYERLCQL